MKQFAWILFAVAALAACAPASKPVATAPEAVPAPVPAYSLYMGLAKQGGTPAALAEAVIEYGTVQGRG